MAAANQGPQLEALARQAAGGDENAFNELYRLTRDRAYFVAYSIAKNEDDALDILQDSYLKAWGKLGSLQNYAVVGAWLNQIVGNTAKDFVKKRRPQLFQPTDEDDDPLAWQSEKDDSYVPDAAMDNAETRRLILGIVDDLPEDQRLCVLMHYYNDLDLHEIASSLELPYETVKSRLRYAKRKISDGVEELERKGTRLRGAAPIPLLVWFLKHGLIETSSRLPFLILGAEAARAGGGILATLTLPKIVAGVAALAVVVVGGAAAIKALPKGKEDPVAATATVTEYEAAKFDTPPTAVEETFLYTYTAPLPPGSEGSFEGQSESRSAFSYIYTQGSGASAPASAAGTRTAGEGAVPPGTSAQTAAPPAVTQIPTSATVIPLVTNAITAASTPTSAVQYSYVAGTTHAVTTKAPASTAAVTSATASTGITTATAAPTTTAIPYVAVTYNYAYNGGSSASKTSASVRSGMPADLDQTAQRSGWTFVGWNTNRNAHEALATLNVNGDTTLYAIFRKDIVLTFHDRDYSGSPDDYSKFSYMGESYRLTLFNNEPAMLAPTLSGINGWTAVGWSATGALGATANVRPGQAISVTDNANYYAVYQRDITVTFDANGGTPAPSSQSLTLNYVCLMASDSNIYPNITMPPAPTKDGAVFAGWLGGGVAYGAGASVKPVATGYVAQWN